MSDGSRLVKIMKEAAKAPDSERVGIVMGEVISITPLKIKVDKLVLTDDFLMLSPFCIKKEITFLHSHEYEDVKGVDHTHSYSDVEKGAHTHQYYNGSTLSTTQSAGSDVPSSKTTGSAGGSTQTKTTSEVSQTVTLWESLSVGESVRMLKCAGGQLYYVLERC